MLFKGGSFDLDIGLGLWWLLLTVDGEDMFSWDEDDKIYDDGNESVDYVYFPLKKI